MVTKLLEFIKSKQSEIVLAIAVVLIAVIAFEGGKISTLKNIGDPLEIKYDPASISSSKSIPTSTKKPATFSQPEKNGSQVIASKNSSLYHFLWCSGAQRIREENKIIFASEQEAQSRGYKLASNCAK